MIAEIANAYLGHRSNVSRVRQLGNHRGRPIAAAWAETRIKLAALTLVGTTTVLPAVIIGEPK